MRIMASCDRLRCLAYPIALLIAFGSPYHSRPNGRASEIRSAPRLSLHGRTSLNVHFFLEATVTGIAFNASMPSRVIIGTMRIAAIHASTPLSAATGFEAQENAHLHETSASSAVLVSTST